MLAVAGAEAAHLKGRNGGSAAPPEQTTAYDTSAVLVRVSEAEQLPALLTEHGGAAGVRLEAGDYTSWWEHATVTLSSLTSVNGSDH